MTDEQIKHMVDRFLAWRLPDDFNPDQIQRIGTHLLTAAQATEMVCHMLEGLPPRSDAQRRVREALKQAGYLSEKPKRYFVSTYTDGPMLWWQVIDRKTHDIVKRFTSKDEAEGYARKLNLRGEDFVFLGSGH